ncbi:hypothetical protein [Desulfotignum balticum]|uniref:hypothetical protein n=1 Tax=Desulfotignum balticum TaxID=115781 RepID=UPI0004625B42|nr:hypothetical protein [Desulfotignum balticum]
MTAKQLNLFEHLETDTMAKDPEHMLALLGAVDGIKNTRFKVSHALDGCADLLAGEPERKDKRFNQFVHKVGRAIKPELLRIDRAQWVEVVRDAAAVQGFIDDGLACLDEIKEFAEAMA